MKEIKLLNLKLENFKGIKSFKLGAQGNDIDIFGDNGTGKTTLVDAHCWLWFDKDSKGNSPQKFEIKTLDEEGEPLHRLDHVVEEKLLIDGKEVELKKVYHEKWETKRGSNQEKFAGHTTDHYINGVPKKKGEYEDFLADIIDEETFKLLTNPRYFNEQLHWEKRREILLDVFGDVSREEIIKANDGLEPLKDILDDRTIEEHRKSIKASMNDLEDKIQEIPTRIDEANRNLPDVSNLDHDSIENKVAKLKKKKKQKEEQMSRIANGGEVAEKKKKLIELDSKLQEIKNNHAEEYRDKIQDKKDELSEAKDQLDDIRRNLRNKNQELKDIKSKRKQLDKEMKGLRQEFKAASKAEFDREQFEFVECPDCGNEFALEDLEEKEKKFNQNKAEKLEQINAKGKAKKKKYQELGDEVEGLQSDIEDLESEKEKLDNLASKIKSEISDLEDKSEDYKDSIKYKKVVSEKKSIQKSVESIQDDKEDKLHEIDNEITKIEGRIEEQKEKLQDIKAHARGQKRIEELEEKENKLTQKYEKLEKEMYLCEEYTRTRVNLLEDKVNQYFDHTEFKLFEKQVNGGITETCIATHNGVPYGTNLNTGAKFKVGLDIINTLSEYYEFRAPIFIDGRESVTKLPNTEAQMISLFVSPEDDELRVKEAGQKEEKEMAVV